ncbi:MAG: 2-dehydropantoate 2-reductase [Betaproteobacteria bacterium]|nr:2-dehydropantoate 2-reductase [Betaproteobacteria bacterium]MDH3438704.1 2-dehydropantoate 2-reductase [Betaproteobacteria bacterium]
MKILIFGAGAIGGYLGGIVTIARADVTLVARGAQLEALASGDLVLESAKTGRSISARVRVCKQGEEKPPYDLIFVGLKAHHLAGTAKHIAGLCSSSGTIVLPQNGIPWWYFEKLDHPLRGTRLPSLDPDGELAKAFSIDSLVGGVAYRPADLVRPGHIRFADQPTDRLVIGELDNKLTPRLQEIASIIEPAGWPVVTTDNIRGFKWSKQMSNAVFNPLGAITQSTALDAVCYPPTRRVAIDMLNEVFAVAGSVGVVPEMTPGRMLDYTQKRVSMASSTLQDVLTGRELELDALVTAVIDIARLTKTPVPTLETVAACAALLNRRIVEDRVAIVPRPVQG